MLINNAIIPKTAKGFDGRSQGAAAAAQGNADVAQSIQNLGEQTQSIFSYAEATHNPGEAFNAPQQNQEQEEAAADEVVTPQPAQPTARPQEQQRTMAAARLMRGNQFETVV